MRFAYGEGATIVVIKGEPKEHGVLPITILLFHEGIQIDQWFTHILDAPKDEKKLEERVRAAITHQRSKKYGTHAVPL